MIGGVGAPELTATLFEKVKFNLGGREYVQFVFVADMADNAPLELSVEQINTSLRRRRAHFEKLQASGKWWNLARSERAPLAPEVREVRWMTISEALNAMGSVRQTQRQVARCTLTDGY